MFHGGHRLRAGRLAGWFLLLVFAGVVPGPVWAQEAPAASPSDQEKQLLAKMLDPKTPPEEELKLAIAVLELDPNNQSALHCRDQANDKIKEKEKEASERQQAEKKDRENKAEGNKLLDQAQNAVAAGNLPLASELLNQAKQRGVTGEKLDTVESAYNLKVPSRLPQLRYLLAGGATVVVGALVGVLVWLKRKKAPYLELRDGRRKGTRYPIEQEITNIGAVEEYGDTRNDIVIQDKLGAVSRLHCQIRIKDGKTYLVDCNSSNGTYLNGQRIPPRRLVPLKNGAEIDLAHSSKMRVGFERKKT